MPRKGENIYKRKDGRWEGRYIKDRADGGKAKYGYIYGKSYREVKEILKRLPGQTDPAKVSVSRQRRSAADVREAAETWFDAIRPKVKESTGMKYRNLLNAYLLPALGDVPLERLTRDRIESYLRELRIKGGARGEGLSAKTVSDVLALLRSILRYAAQNGEQPGCDARSVRIKNTPREMRVLTRAEQERLCRYLYSELSAPNLGILVCLFTGLRVGEVCALQWEDISIAEKTIHVCRTMQRIQRTCETGPKSKVIVTEPKSPSSIRTIPLPEGIAEAVAKYGQMKKGYFLTGNAEKYMEPRTMQNHFKRAIRQCGVAPANFHALRHTFATRCVEVGFDVKTLSEILGHASVSITMNRYVHPSIELKRENMQRLSSLIAVS